jgi:hypothetical protein
VEGYFHRLLDFAHHTDWGKRAIGRAAARARR